MVRDVPEQKSRDGLAEFVVIGDELFNRDLHDCGDVRSVVSVAGAEMDPDRVRDVESSRPVGAGLGEKARRLVITILEEVREVCGRSEKLASEIVVRRIVADY